MITIKNPEKYINEPNILKYAGEYINKLGKHAVIIGGKTALSVVGEEFFTSLINSSVVYEVVEFAGHCTTKALESFTTIVKESKVDIIIGVGGGSVLDLTKGVGELSNLPVVTVPTIAATCAAWSALTVVYDENGKHERYFKLDNAPKLVLADTNILAAAPVRYLNAGIADTIAKWYEATPHITEESNDFSLKLGIQTSKLALDILKEKGVLAVKEVQNKSISKGFSEVVDAIVMLAGFVGGVNGGDHRGALGHALHNSLTAIPDTHSSLHGEKVIFGVLVQLILEGKPQKEIDEFITFLNELNLPVTLEQLGIKDDVASKVFDIAKGIDIIAESLHKVNFSINTQLIEEAIIKADELGKISLK